MMLEEALSLESYKTLPMDFDWMHLETVELKENVFVIPYDTQGLLSQTKRIELDLNKGAKIIVMQGRDKGTKGEVIGRNGYHFRFRLNYVAKSKKINAQNPAPQKPAMRTFGAWWIQLYVAGHVNKLNVMNVTPKLVPADFKMPPPKPRRAKRIIDSSDKQPQKLKTVEEPQLSTGKLEEMKEPQPITEKLKKKKTGKKSKQPKSFVAAKKSLKNMSNLYSGLE